MEVADHDFAAGRRRTRSVSAEPSDGSQQRRACGLMRDCNEKTVVRNDNGRPRGRPLHIQAKGAPYFNAFAIVLNFDDRLVPTRVIAPIITTEIRPAIRPYSIAVAPDWLRAKPRMNADMGTLSLSNAPRLFPACAGVTLGGSF